MKLTKMTLWILIGLGSSIALLALIYWKKFSYLIPVSIGICSAAIPLQIILYRQTRTKKRKTNLLNLFNHVHNLLYLLLIYNRKRSQRFYKMHSNRRMGDKLYCHNKSNY